VPAAVASTPLAVETVDLAFVDLAFADTAFTVPTTTTLRVKAAGADAARLRTAAGGSAPFDRSLLVAARRFHQTIGPEQQEEARYVHDGASEFGESGFGDVDEFFTKLGKMRLARKALRHAV
jgi:hypothetical protein